MAANLDGALTPRPQNRTAQALLPDTAEIRELLIGMKGTLTTLYVHILIHGRQYLLQSSTSEQLPTFNH
jgi:hypothetical protein